MKNITLTQGKEAIVDDCDFEELNRHKWYAAKPRKIFYAVRNLPGTPQRQIRMHRIILNAPKGQEIDHKDGDGLHNWRKNLRFCTNTENQHNRFSRTGSSRFKGVCWHSRDNKWQSNIRIKRKHTYLGSYDNEIEAALAYDKAARKYFGEFARVNF